MIPMICLVAFGRIALMMKFIQRIVMISKKRIKRVKMKEKTNLRLDFKIHSKFLNNQKKNENKIKKIKINHKENNKL